MSEKLCSLKKYGGGGSSSLADHATMYAAMNKANFIAAAIPIYAGDIVRVEFQNTSTPTYTIDNAYFDTLDSITWGMDAARYYHAYILVCKADCIAGTTGIIPKGAYTRLSIIDSAGTSPSGGNVDTGTVILNIDTSVRIDLGYQPSDIILYMYGEETLRTCVYTSDFTTGRCFKCTFTKTAAGGAGVTNINVGSTVKDGTIITVDSTGFEISKIQSGDIARYGSVCKWIAFR